MYKTLYTREYQQMLALLRAKRTDAQVSQVELARRLEWTQADVSKCETGVRRLDVIELRIWLKALGYELADFVQALDNSVPPTTRSGPELSRCRSVSHLRIAHDIENSREHPDRLLQACRSPLVTQTSGCVASRRRPRAVSRYRCRRLRGLTNNSMAVDGKGWIRSY